MCGIIAWNVQLSELEIRQIIDGVKNRGRNGWGFWHDGKETRGMDTVEDSLIKELSLCKRVVGNFRATPTTEAMSSVEILQPYSGLVHNGTIANDKEFFDYKIDSMVVDPVLKKFGYNEVGLSKLVGSYAIAKFNDEDLFLACNYKPLFYQSCRGGYIFASMPYMLPQQNLAVQFQAYTWASVKGGEIDFHELQLQKNNKVILACSSGLDSTTVAYHLKSQGYDVHLAHFLYGCLAEGREVEKVKAISKHGGFKLTFLELPKVFSGTIVSGEYNKRGDGVSGAEFAHDWVSARNLLILATLTAYAETNKLSYIALGNNLEEAGAYPDNEEVFGYNFNKLLPNCTQNGVSVSLLQPLAHMMKHEIVELGLRLKVPYEYTWSCYSNQNKPCGQCGPCFMRLKAFERNGSIDPLEYLK